MRKPRCTSAWCERLRDDEGNAIVEFVGLSVVLMIPLVYLVLTLAQVQAATFAADTVARQSARIASTEPDERARTQRVAAVVELASHSYGVQVSARQVDITCTPAPCAPGSVVRVAVTVGVSPPGLWFVSSSGGLLSVSSSHALRIDEHTQWAR